MTWCYWAVSFFLLLLLTTCHPRSLRPDLLAKIKFPLSELDENGLLGPADGKVSLDYEFCIPRDSALLRQVTALDTSLVVYPGSRGRVGCTSDEWLLIGNTYRQDYREVLSALARRKEIKEIRRVYYE